MIKIRKATRDDSKAITDHIILAMEEIIYHFIGENSHEKAILFLNNLVQERENQYSFENCWVAEIENKIVAAAIVYNGAKLNELRKPVERKIKEIFNRNFSPEDETGNGEYYIDCIGVNPNQQGKGIGSKILNFLIDEYVFKKKTTLGLLVDQENPNAKKLYLKSGFEIVGQKTLAGKKLYHLQIKP